MEYLLNFIQQKILLTYNVDINHILVSNESKDPIGKKCFKYFIGYLNHFDGNLTPLYITLPKLKVSLKSFSKVKHYLCFKKNIMTYQKDKKILKVEFVHDDEYIPTKIKSYENEIKTDFHDDGLPPE